MKQSASQLIKILCGCIFVALMAACSSKPAAALPPPSVVLRVAAETAIPATATAVLPTATDVPPTPAPTPTPATFPVDFPQPGMVVQDFVALACDAHWANGARALPCPGDQSDLADGFIAPAEHAVAEGLIPVDAPLLIGLPGLGGEHGAGLFGIYPPISIRPGDTFHAGLACQAGSACDVEFALEYRDAQGNYQHDMGWSWQHRYGGGPLSVQEDLSPLAGQTVQLVLVVRDQGTPQDDWVLWVYPYIARQAQ